MTACAGCGMWGMSLCHACRSGFFPGPPRRLTGGILVMPGLLHEGSARRLVHRLKYHGDPAAARILAEAMAPLVPHDATALVPVPRARLRTWRYGVDPALELARALAVSGIGVARVLRADWWWPGHAGRTMERRHPPRFYVRSAVPPGSVLVDDVVTTGGTLGAASDALGGAVRRAVTATGA